jgi:hypothetical protein
MELAATTSAAFWEVTQKEFADNNFKLDAKKDTKVSEKPAIRVESHGEVQGRALHFLSLAVFDEKRVLLVTCTVLEAEWKDREKALVACLDSVRILPRVAEKK